MMIKSSDSHTVSYRTLKPPLLFTLCTEMCICPGIQLAYPMHRNEQLSQNPACLPYAQKCVPESSLFTVCTEMCMGPRIQLVYPINLSRNPACLPYAQKCAAVPESSSKISRRFGVFYERSSNY